MADKKSKARNITKTEDISNIQLDETLKQLAKDINELNKVVNSAVNDELDRLIPLEEKRRIIKRNEGNEEDASIYFDEMSLDEKLRYIAICQSREDEVSGNKERFKEELKRVEHKKEQMKQEIKAKANSLIVSMNQIIEENRDQLGEYEKIRSLEEMLADEEIYVGNYSNIETTKSGYSYNKLNTVNSNGEETKSNLSTKKKASNILENLLTISSVEELRNMLRSNTYKELITMATNIERQSDRTKLGEFCDVAFTDMRKSDKGPKLDGAKALLNSTGLKLKHLRDMSDLDENQVRGIQDILSDLQQNRENKTHTEIEDGDLLMDYVKLGMLKRHAESLGVLKKLFRSKEKELRFNALTSQLEEHASNQYTEHITAINEENEFRRLLKQPPVDATKRVERPKTIMADKVFDHDL